MKQPRQESFDPLTKMRGLEGEDCLLPDLGRFEGIVELEKDDILVQEEPYSFCLLGSFAGRFPGMKAIAELIKSWGVRCKSESLANGHVLFRFYKDDERQNVLNGGPYALYGKRLFLHSPSNDVSLGFEDCRKLPIWIRMPWLPKACWHVNALSKIAGNFGKPLYRDKFTMEMKKTAFARILVEVDCSINQPDHVSIKLPGGNSFDQRVVFEVLPSFCTRCGSNKHITEFCPPNRVEKSKKGADVNDISPPKVVPTCSAGSDNNPEINETGTSLNGNEGLESPLEDRLNKHDNGKSPQAHENFEAQPKEVTNHHENAEVHSSDDEFDSMFGDSLRYGFMDSTLFYPIAFISNIEDGVFGTRPHGASSSQTNQKKKKNKKSKVPVTGGAGKQLKR